MRAFTDLMFAPVPIALVVAAVAALLADRARGIFQLSGPRDISYSEAAHFLARRLVPTNADRGHERPRWRPAARRGRAVHLTHFSTLRARYGIVVPDAWEVLDRIP